MELDFKVQTRSECRKKQTRFLHTGQISFHEKVKKQTNKKNVSCSSESQAKYMTVRYSPIVSCQSWSKRCGTTPNVYQGKYVQ